MSKIITRLSCIDCGKEFTIEGRFDEHTDDVVTCPHCNLQLTKWCYEYIGDEKDGQ